MSINDFESKDDYPRLTERLKSWLGDLPAGLFVYSLDIFSRVIPPIFPEEEADSWEDLTDGDPKTLKTGQTNG